MVVVAQLVRALVCGAGSRGFESHLPPFTKRLRENEVFFCLHYFLLPFSKQASRIYVFVFL